MKGEVQSVEVSFFVHATEDPATLTKAVSAVLAVGPPPVEEKLEGHFGNQILRIRYHLIGDDAAAVLGAISARLPVQAKRRLNGRMGELVDEHSALYLRFDKQRLVEGTLEEGSGDPVRVRVKPRGYALRGGAREYYSRVLFGGG